LNKLVNTFMAGAALAILVWGGMRFVPNDENLIRKKLGQLAQTASVKPGQSMISRANSLNRLRDYFSPDVLIEIDDWGQRAVTVHGRNDLISLASAAQPHLREAKFKFVDLSVQVEKNRNEASALMTVLGDLNGERYAISQVLKMRLEKIEGEWLISRVETVQVLQ
jgi:hypothetical protein